MAQSTRPRQRASNLATLATAKYIRLITYRRTGDAVATPVWFAFASETIYVESGANAGKIKRIRHTPRVALAPCDIRGGVTGPMVEGMARVLASKDEIAIAEAALAQKYGFTRTLYYGVMGFARRLVRKPTWDSDYLAIKLTT
ncbi:MAG: PPOX class F420-dependent oxidoreductase [Ktedonobacterales bacterium]|nr:PPOX class F420-dependent oxidoreductase [Ktedonobacterales bacterium]